MVSHKDKDRRPERGRCGRVKNGQKTQRRREEKGSHGRKNKSDKNWGRVFLNTM